jgi:hypothetical protein
MSVDAGRAIRQYEDRMYGIKKSIESGVNLASVTGQIVKRSPDQLFEEAKKLELEAAKVGWKGLLYLQLHMGDVAMYSNEGFVIPTSKKKIIISRDSEIWDPMKPRENSYGTEEVDALIDSDGFETHIRMAVLNPEGRLSHYGQMSCCGEGDTIEGFLDEVKRDLEIVKPTLNIGTLNLMGVLALSAMGYAEDFRYGQTENLVPIIEKREHTSGRLIGTVTIARGGDILLGDYNGNPRDCYTQVGIGLSVGLTD